MSNNLSILEETLGVIFEDKAPLIQALTHPSYCNENRSNLQSNQKLEFLGDAVLELCMRNYLYQNYSLSEGEMTKTRAKLVCEDALVVYSRGLDIPNFLFLGKGEEQSGGRQRPAVLADAFEAVMASVFDTFGFETSYKVFLKTVVPHIDALINKEDYKSTLQELLQSKKKSITYKIISQDGPPHDRVFEAAAIMDTITLGTGKGKTKLKAEQEAAKVALSKAAG